MSEQRLIDAESIEYTKFCEAFGNGMYKDVDVVYRTDIDAMPTIDPETLPVVQRLRGQNEKLNAGIGNMAENIRVVYRQRDKLLEELGRVKAERDAAVSDLENIMAYNSDTCQLCKNKQCYVRGGTKPCLPKWRGQQKEE